MNKYLTEEQLKAKLSLGKAVEQWLGHYESDGEAILKWVRIYPEKEEYNVLYIECYDQGSVDYLDISDFTVVDPDEPYGLLDTFYTLDEAFLEYTFLPSNLKSNDNLFLYLNRLKYAGYTCKEIYY